MIKDKLLENNIELIPISDIEITHDPNETVGYDLTVEDFYTFSSYDGVFVQDTMAVYHPLTNEAQIDIQTKMMRTENFDTMSEVNFSLSKEMCAGLYMISKDIKTKSSPISVTDKELNEAKNPYIPVVYRGKQTTTGRALINSAFPSSFPFIDKMVTKSDINKLIPIILEKYGQQQALDTFSKLKDIGFKFATILAPTITIDDIEIPDSIIKLKEKLKKATPDEAQDLLKQMESLLKEHLKNSGLYDIIESGSAKGWGQPMQLLVAKGIIADPKGNVLPTITASFADGLTNTEYFNAASGARKGIADRVLNTATTGYFSRQLAYVLNSVELDRYLKDCKTKRTLSFKLTSDLAKRMKGRYVLVNDKVQLFNENDFKIGSTIYLRSPIFCESPKICHTCYGELLKRHKSPYAGIIAAQLVGESGTQTIMKSFHTGGAIKIIKIDILKDIVQNDPLVILDSVKKYLEQKENSLVCLKDCIITLNLEDYPLPGDVIFQDEESNIRCKSLVCSIEFDDLIFNIILDYTVLLQNEEIIQQTKEILKLKYLKDSTILTVPMQTDDTKSQITYANRLLGGREIYKDANHLFLKFFNIYAPLRSMDIVHMEILLSQVLRDKKNNSLPARLGKTWDPVMMNIKKIVFKTSFIQGLAFENINEAIKTGLITEEPGEASILERVLTGELSVDKKK